MKNQNINNAINARAAEHQGFNRGMQMIDGCSLELCVTTLSVAPLGHRNKLNSIV